MPEIFVPVSTAELSWRVLGFVNGLRLLAASALATLFVSIMPETIGQLDPALFAGAATAYFLYAVISISSIRRRAPDLVLQTWTGVFADVLVLSLLTYASGGVNDGIAALVTLSVGATSFILRRRLAMSIAVGASFAMLIQPAISLLADTDAVADFASAAISGALTIIIGLGISQLARVLRQNEELVRLREADAGDLNDLHRSIAQYLREGVLVVDGENKITLISDPAATLLQGGGVLVGSTLEEVSPRLANLLETWRSYYCDENRSSPTMMGYEGDRRLQLKFVSLDGGSQGPALIFVDDKARMPVWSPESMVPASIQVNKMPVPREPAPIVREVARSEPLVSAGVSEGAYASAGSASAAQGRAFESPYAASPSRQRALEAPYANIARERPFEPSYSAGAPRERQREPAFPPPEPPFEDSMYGSLAAVSALRPSEPKPDPFRADSFRDSGRRSGSRADSYRSEDFPAEVDRASSLRENLARQNSFRAALQEVSPWENPKPQPKAQPKPPPQPVPVPVLAPPPVASAPPAPARREPPRPPSSMLSNNDPRLRIIIGNALQFGRRESLRLERVDLASWAKEFVTEFWQTEEIDSDTLRVNAPRESLLVRADPGHLHKLVWGLCSDLLKYGRPSNATDPVELRVGRSTKTQRRYLDLIDRGTAVGPVDSKRVFEPFLAVGKAGTGIAMFVSRELSPGVRTGANSDPRPGGGVVFRLVFAEAPTPKPVEPAE